MLQFIIIQDHFLRDELTWTEFEYQNYNIFDLLVFVCC